MSGKLFREKELTAPEASRHASASHGTLPACATGTAGGCPAVPVEGPMQKARTAEELCVHSFALAGSRSRHRRCEVGGRARRRSFCVRCTPFISEASIPAAEGACTHAMLAHHTVLTCVLASCARRRWKGSGAHTKWISMTGQVVARCYPPWCLWLCNGLRQDATRDARERVALGALYTRCTVPCEHVLFGAMSKRVI